MSAFWSLVQAVVCLAVIYLLALNLRRRNILEEGHSLTLARIVTDLCLPAVVFVNLAGRDIQWSQMDPAFLMLAAEISCILLAWGVCLLLRLPKEETGAVVFCSAFGSSTFLGYAVIMEMFPTKPQAMTEAVLISEIGVGYPIFILGPMLAAYFGSSASGLKDNLKSSLAFFKSPVFFALILGLAWSRIGLPGEENQFIRPLMQVCKILGQALTPLAIISVGLMFKIPPLGRMLAALGVVVAIKLLIKPFALGYSAELLAFPKLWRDVLVILGGMPPAVLGAVFLRRYGGEASLASALLLTATVISCATLLLVFWGIG